MLHLPHSPNVVVEFFQSHHSPWVWAVVGTAAAVWFTFPLYFLWLNWRAVALPSLEEYRQLPGSQSAAGGLMCSHCGSQYPQEKSH